MKVPEGKLILIGNKKYKPGKELPAGYVLKEKKPITQKVEHSKNTCFLPMLQKSDVVP